ncbi:metallophosphoesterase [Nocardia sp. NPDC058633]|uniref:metallophosphoesterase n=1 Tax=Nocardia sp. NPDC058633 TaxID=3346568 RepID=UPI00365458C8
MSSAVVLIVIVLVLAVMLAVPWWVLVAGPTGRSGSWFRVGTAACVLGGVGLPIALFLGHGPPQFDPAAIVGDVALGVLWVVFTWSVIGLVVRGALSVGRVRGARVTQGIALGVVVVSVVLSGYGLYEARRVPQVRTVDVAIPGLAEGLDGLRVVVLTDTHFAALDRERWSRQVVDEVNAQRPDIVGLAGDLVDGSVDKRRDQVAPLAGVEAPLGRFYITGNHEYLDDAQSWIDYMASIGWQPLHNAHRTVDRDGDRLVVAGIDDPAGTDVAGHGPDLPAALAGTDPQLPVVLLAHQPKQVADSAAAGVELQISGHTHGGQIWPFHYLVRLDQPVVAGLSRHANNTQLYTSRGTGYWGPPLRVFAPSEITVLVLHPDR